jgi:molecular chaperone DnaJ
MKKSPYEILEIEKSASEEEIKKAYRKLSKQHHPDRNPGDEEADKKYKEVQSAYEELTNPKQNNNFPFPSDFFGDLFSSFQQNRIETVEIPITFMESLLGVKKDVTFNSPMKCPTCSGQGNDPSCEPKHCDVCGGLGKLSSRHGNTIISRSCGHCEGRGRIIEKICCDCLGSGEINKNNQVTVSLPAGVFRGMKVRLADQVVGIINVKTSEYLSRKDSDLFVEIFIPLSNALCGGEVTVPSSSGLLTVKTPKNAQNGTVLRIREKGFPYPDKQELKGDLYVKINICIPEIENVENMDIIKEAEKKSTMNSLKKFETFIKSVT